MAGRTYVCARVSMRKQNLDRQLDALHEFGVDGVFADKASGKDFERPEWMRLTAALRAGSVLVVKSIDWLGRGYEEIIEQWRAIAKEIHADVVVLDMSLLDIREEGAASPARSYPISCCSCCPTWPRWSARASTSARRRASPPSRRTA